MHKHHFPFMNRRSFLRGIGLAAMGAVAAPLAPKLAFAAEASPAAKKPLVVYFSHSGNTQKLAEMIHKHVGGDIVRIEPAKAYPEEYNDLTKYAKAEKEKGARPDIKNHIDNINQYGIVFLGYPNWWSTMPMPVFTFVEQNGLNGKTIAPFTTHGGGGLAGSAEDLKKIAPNAKILTPLAISGNTVDRAEKDVLKWLKGLGAALSETTTGNPAIYPEGAY